MRWAAVRNWPLLVLLGLVGFAVAVVQSGVSLQDLPSVGGVRGKTYPLTIEVADAVNLPAHAHVRLGGADIGTVREIRAQSYRAILSVEVREGVELPVGTAAELRQATPLGDLFVALTPPARPTGTLMTAGDTIPLERTRSAPQVEDLLSAASLLVNGGAIADVSTILREANAMLKGNESHLGGVSNSIGTLAGVLNERSADIDAQLAEMRTVTRTLNEGRDLIRKGLVDFTPAIKVAADERASLQRLANKLQRLSVPLRELINSSSTDLISSVNSLSQVLNGLADIGGRLAPTLRNMLVLADVVRFSTRGENLAGVGYFRISPTLIQSALELILGTAAGGGR